jgi:hypothetical protein
LVAFSLACGHSGAAAAAAAACCCLLLPLMLLKLLKLYLERL